VGTKTRWQGGVELLFELDPSRRGDPTRIWVIAELSDRWSVGYLCRLDDGRLTIVQLLAFPYEKGEKLVAPELDANSAIPAGGLTTRVLRNIRPAAHLQEAITQLRERYLDDEIWGPVVESLWRVDARALVPRPTSRGRKPHSPTFLATVAALYVAALDRGSKQPLNDVVSGLERQKRHYSKPHVRDLIRRARREGYLTRTQKGRAGGLLTEKAEQALQSQFGPNEPKGS
jgi:hypothetical protein